jgi:Tfp pilus assembly protein PilO
MAVTSRSRSGHTSVKRLQIDKSQSMMVIAAAIAAFVLSFAVVGGKTLIGQIAYQNKVISAKKTAVNQLRTNVQSTTNLKNAYTAFVTTTQNVLGGNPQGSGPQDGDNAKIVLDALPSKYDFPALTTSLEKMIVSQSMQIESITGSDDEVAQTDQSSPDPQPVAIPFSMSATGNYSGVQNIVNTLGASIRPFQVQKLELSGGQDKMNIKIDAQTFYQPAKNFDMKTKVVK